MEWDTIAQKKFDSVMDEVPTVFRPTARGIIIPAAEDIARQQNRSKVTEQDVLQAFYREIPPIFHEELEPYLERAEFDLKLVSRTR